MSVGTAAGDGTTTASRARARWRRWKWPLTVTAIVLLVTVVSVLATPGGTGRRLDPASPNRAGARAVAEILREQGVDVRWVVRSSEASSAGAGATLVVVDPYLLGPDQLNRLAVSSADLVLVEPGPEVLARLAPEVIISGQAGSDVVEPRCDLAAARTAGRARVRGLLYRFSSTTPDSTLCYPTGDRGDEGSYLVTRNAGRRVVVLGQGDVLTNQHLAEDGNAALALHTLGAAPVLHWYVPDPMELGASAEPTSPLDLLPAGLRWAAVALCLAVLVCLLWRSRRLGPLVREPLPVVVRSAETQQGRARLYRRAKARGRAAATLRTAALRRIAARLGLSADTTPDQVAALAAHAVGADSVAVHTVLLGPAPTDDAALVRLADDLDAVEQKLTAQAPRPAAARPAAPSPAATREVRP